MVLILSRRMDFGVLGRSAGARDAIVLVEEGMTGVHGVGHEVRDEDGLPSGGGGRRISGVMWLDEVLEVMAC